MDVVYEYLCLCERGYENICKWIKLLGFFLSEDFGSKYLLKGFYMEIIVCESLLILFESISSGYNKRI